MIGFLGFDLVFGAGPVVITPELIGDALQAAAALDTVVKAEPAVVGGLIEASVPFFGAVELLISALFLSSAAYATLATGAQGGCVVKSPLDAMGGGIHDGAMPRGPQDQR